MHLQAARCHPASTEPPTPQALSFCSSAVPLKSWCTEQRTLRRAQPSSPGTWSPCGRTSPPRRLERLGLPILTGSGSHPRRLAAGPGAQTRFSGRRSGSPAGTAGPPLSGLVWLCTAEGLSRQEGVRDPTRLLPWVPLLCSKGEIARLLALPGAPPCPKPRNPSSLAQGRAPLLKQGGLRCVLGTSLPTCRREPSTHFLDRWAPHGPLPNEQWVTHRPRTPRHRRSHRPLVLGPTKVAAPRHLCPCTFPENKAGPGRQWTSPGLRVKIAF